MIGSAYEMWNLTKCVTSSVILVYREYTVNSWAKDNFWNEDKRPYIYFHLSWCLILYLQDMPRILLEAFSYIWFQNEKRGPVILGMNVHTL